MGARFTSDYFKRAYGLRDEDLLPSETQSEQADFAENDVSQTFENEVSGSLKDDLAQQGQDLTTQFLSNLKNGATPDDVLTQLTQAYPQMNDKTLQEELARLIFLADLVGRLEVQAELAE